MINTNLRPVFLVCFLCACVLCITDALISGAVFSTEEKAAACMTVIMPAVAALICLDTGWGNGK